MEKKGQSRETGNTNVRIILIHHKKVMYEVEYGSSYYREISI